MRQKHAKLNCTPYSKRKFIRVKVKHYGHLIETDELCELTLGLTVFEN